MLISIHDQRTQLTTSHIRSVDGRQLDRNSSAAVNRSYKIRDDIVSIVILIK